MSSNPFARVGSALKRRLMSEEDKVKQKDSLFETVQDGDIVEHFMRSPAWLKIIGPWLEKEKTKADDRLHTVTHEFAQDEVGFAEVGKVGLVEDFRSMLNEKLTNREVARQKVSELQLTGEEDGNG